MEPQTGGGAVEVVEVVEAIEAVIVSRPKARY